MSDRIKELANLHHKKLDDICAKGLEDTLLQIIKSGDIMLYTSRVNVPKEDSIMIGASCIVNIETYATLDYIPYREVSDLKGKLEAATNHIARLEGLCESNGIEIMLKYGTYNG